MYSSLNRKYEFTIIAETADRFIDFSPYVASINNNGIISFQAESANGITGIYSGDGKSLNIIIKSAESKFKKIYSHPDINNASEYCFYAEQNSGSEGVFLYRNNDTASLADTDSIFKSIGPLGPVMNEAGEVAFRADLNTGHSGIFICNSSGVSKIADTESMFAEFSGLPVINSEGTVAFSAAMKNHVKGICKSNDGSYEVIADTGNEFTDFGRFADINDAGIIVFTALNINGSPGIFTYYNREINSVAETADGFESFRIALINNSGNIIFYGVTKEGKEGVFKGNDPAEDMIISLKDNLFDSPVSEIVFNPVSLNDKGQIALRIKLENDHQLILRAELY